MASFARPLWRSAAGFVLTTSLACTGARLATKSELEGKTGSCEVACEHYEYCKGTRDDDRERACISECRTIFSEDGAVDGASLYRLESLSCSQLLLFIEGPGKRPPGEEQS